MITPIGQPIGPRVYVGQDSKGRDSFVTLTRESFDTATLRIENEDNEIVFESEMHQHHVSELAFQLLAIRHTKVE